MKSLHSLLSVFLLCTSGLSLADPPQNRRADRYRDLYLNSPITDPPPVEVAEPEVNDLPDWVLVGVTKYLDRTKVQIMNIKDRTRVVIPSQEATELGFSVKDVTQDRNYLKNTVVTLQKGNATGEVRFDPKFLVLKKVAGPSGASPRPASPQNRNANRGNNRNANANANPNANRRSANQPPSLPGARSSNNQNATPRPRAVPQPSSAQNPSTSSPSSNRNSRTPTRRTRYVPRPKK